MNCPDLRPNFPTLHWRPMPHSFGVPVASDWQDKSPDDPVFGIFRECGMWTMDEAAILYQVAKQTGGAWVDIGANVGWTTAHVAAADCKVLAVDPMYRNDEFRYRANHNLIWCDVRQNVVTYSGLTSAAVFGGMWDVRFAGVVIDGDHDDPNPTTDAAMAACHLRDNGAILFHDARVEPVRKAIRWLLKNFPEFKHRIYPTPHGVALCWRGDLDPPDYEQLPGVPGLEI